MPVSTVRETSSLLIFSFEIGVSNGLTYCLRNCGGIFLSKGGVLENNLGYVGVTVLATRAT